MKFHLSHLQAMLLFAAADIHRVRISDAARRPLRAREIYCMVIAALSVVRHRNWLGHVPVLALNAFAIH